MKHIKFYFINLAVKIIFEHKKQAIMDLAFWEISILFFLIQIEAF